ncbi:MAG: glycosyltransferase family 39 protein [Acidobacteriota bacterium]
MTEDTRRRLYLAAVTTLVALHAALALSAAARIGVTIDEPIGMASGYALLTERELRINVGQPPVVKIVAALPLLYLHPGFDPAQPSYQAGQMWTFSRQFLFETGANVPICVAASRAATLSFSVALALVLAARARRSFGRGGALIALALYALDPTFLGHGPIVKFDVASALFIFLAVMGLRDALDAGSAPRLALAGFWAGLAMATKFSSILVFPVCVLLAACACWKEGARRGWLVRAAPGWIAGVALGIAIPYGIVLVPDFFHGLAWHRARMKLGYLSYFWGHTGKEGHWLYFPVAFVLKTPLPILAVTGLAVVCALRRPRDPVATGALLAALLLFVPLLPSPANVGHRYLIPVYPFLYFVAGGLARDRLGRAAAVVAVALLAAGAAWSFPDYLGSTNLIAGSRPERYIADSNLDWGQDLPRLAEYLRGSGGGERVRLAYSGMDQPEQYGIDYEPAPCHAEPGFYAASINVVKGILPPERPDCYRWLDAHDPVARVGTSMLVYRIPAEPAVAP